MTETWGRIMRGNVDESQRESTGERSKRHIIERETVKRLLRHFKSQREREQSRETSRVKYSILPKLAEDSS